ncbi:hypothetical protein [Arthrobacter sp. SO3]|uniref:baeRF8 domain-containing protein n=1 Tax=Arthrobacter sp. SO3 TaxID=1897057 RepID=UPI001CFF9C58|nr:hypothetical protein [Arthrobacter sp. SO3]MCB5292132.1 hypothetical protein [Arthrobacter sp. SO3]
MIAATEPLTSIYRNLTGYAHLAPEVIEGNPDELTPAELAEAARGVLDRIYSSDLVALHPDGRSEREPGYSLCGDPICRTLWRRSESFVTPSDI